MKKAFAAEIDNRSDDYEIPQNLKNFFVGKEKNLLLRRFVLLTADELPLPSF